MGRIFVLPSGDLLDTRPWAEGKPALRFNGSAWVEEPGCPPDMGSALAATPEEIASAMAITASAQAKEGPVADARRIFSLPSGGLLDISPCKDGKPPLFFDGSSWKPSGIPADLGSAKVATPEEIASAMAVPQPTSLVDPNEKSSESKSTPSSSTSSPNTKMQINWLPSKPGRAVILPGLQRNPSSDGAEPGSLSEATTPEKKPASPPRKSSKNMKMQFVDVPAKPGHAIILPGLHHKPV